MIISSGSSLQLICNDKAVRSLEQGVLNVSSFYSFWNNFACSGYYSGSFVHKLPHLSLAHDFCPVNLVFLNKNYIKPHHNFCKDWRLPVYVTGWLRSLSFVVSIKIHQGLEDDHAQLVIGIEHHFLEGSEGFFVYWIINEFE